ncbi:MAG: histidine phosphatase family protein [Variovorax sp.]|jgi:broad specificity phosphatase PhoE|nr:MAG: histidine phosphatase family protein [Variovorax sp.]
MGTLYLVRHGQASFGAADYDRLSALGHRQAVRLGEHWKERGMRFDAVITGTLRRHGQTWDGIAEGLGLSTREATPWPGLNEYDSDAVIAALEAGPLGRPDTPEGYKHHFRLLRDGLGRWMDGRTAPTGMPSYVDFLAGVTGALDHVREHHHGSRVLVVSSGGPIGLAVAHVLGGGTAAAIELNMRIRNTAVTEFVVTPRRHALLTFNTLPHLDAAAYEDWVTYA